jgi:hypothetical protein
MKDDNMLRIFGRSILKNVMAKLRKIAYGNQAVIMNLVNYIINQI